MMPIEPGGVDRGVLRQAFGSFPSGVIAVCALHQDAPVGMAVSSFTSVSLEPPLVSVCVRNTSATWPRLRERRRVGVSVLAENQDRACRDLSGKDGDRFANVDWCSGDGGAVFVRGAAAWFDCSVDDEWPAGDHVIVLLRIRGLATRPDAAPLVFHGSRFRRLDLVASP